MLFKFQNRDSLAVNNEALQAWTLRKKTPTENDSWEPAGLKVIDESRICLRLGGWEAVRRVPTLPAAQSCPVGAFVRVTQARLCVLSGPLQSPEGKESWFPRDSWAVFVTGDRGLPPGAWLLLC